MTDDRHKQPHDWPGSTSLCTKCGRAFGEPLAGIYCSGSTSVDKSDSSDGKSLADHRVELLDTWLEGPGIPRGS